jgi:ribonuclease D
LKEIWLWRDGMASRRDKPPFKIISNDQILSMSVSLAAGKSVALPPRFRPGQRDRFEKGVARAKAVPEEALPKWERKKRLAKANDWERVFKAIRSARDQAATDYDLEPSIISSKACLERYAFAKEADRTQELRNELFLPWQQELIFPEGA